MGWTNFTAMVNRCSCTLVRGGTYGYLDVGLNFTAMGNRCFCTLVRGGTYGYLDVGLNFTAMGNRCFCMLALGIGIGSLLLRWAGRSYFSRGWTPMQVFVVLAEIQWNSSVGFRLLLLLDLACWRLLWRRPCLFGLWRC